MKSAVVWIGIVVGLLSMSVVTQAILLFNAVNDPSFAVEPDYERKAANWDEIQLQKRRSADLGWTTALATTPGAEPGTVDVRFSIEDAAGRPVDGALVSLEAFHNARASRIFSDNLLRIEPGIYAGTLPLRPSGVWEFRVQATRETARFAQTLRKDVLSIPRSVPYSRRLPASGGP